MSSQSGPKDGERGKLPGDKGYLAYWRRQMNGAGLGKLRGQSVGGKSLLLVLKSYGDHANNSSGECWPSQELLAVESGTSVSTVKRVQDWAIEHGWLVVVAKPIPRRKGLHVALRVGRAPNSLSKETQLPVSDMADSLSKTKYSLSEQGQLPVSSDGQTLIRTLSSNSQVRTTVPSAIAAANSKKQILVPEPFPDPPPKGREKVYVGSCPRCAFGTYEKLLEVHTDNTLSYICSNGYLVRSLYEKVPAGERGSYRYDLRVREGIDPLHITRVDSELMDVLTSG